MKKTKLTRSLLAACSIVALSAVAYGCSSGISQSEADKQAAEAAAAAKAEAEAAAAAAAAEAAAKAEAERQAALDAQQAALEKAARAKVQAANIGAATAAAETALGMVVLGASDTDIADADAKLQALRDAITAAVDVDDTSADTLKADGIETSLTTAKALVMQERGDRKAERAEDQQGVIDAAIADANAAVALVVEGASNEVITAAESAVQAAEDAITAAVDVDDTSMDTETVNGIASALMDAKAEVLADRLQDRIDMQTADIDAAIRAAQSALKLVTLGATDEQMDDADAKLAAARTAIADAEDVEDTSEYTAEVNGIAASLLTAKNLVEKDRRNQEMARAVVQTANIMTAINAANAALDAVDIEATDEEIAAAEKAVKDANDAIADAKDVDDTSMYTAQVAGIKGKLDIAHTLALSYRGIQQQNAIDMAVTAAEGAVDMVGPDADADDVSDADAKVEALDDAITAAVDVDDTSAAATTLAGLQDALGDRKTLRKAIMDASTALAALDNDSSDDDIEAVQDLIDDAEEAIGAAEHLSDEEKAEFSAKIDDEDDGLQAMLDDEETTILAAREQGKTQAKEAMARA